MAERERPEVPESQRIIGERIARYRQARKWSGRELARRAGLDPSHLLRIEHGEVGSPPPTFAKIAEALGVPLKELVNEDPHLDPEWERRYAVWATLQDRLEKLLKHQQHVRQAQEYGWREQAAIVAGYHEAGLAVPADILQETIPLAEVPAAVPKKSLARKRRTFHKLHMMELAIA